MLLTSAHGTVVEIDAGCGSNLLFYRPQVDHLHLCEPDRERAGSLTARLAEFPDLDATVRIARAEQLPFHDDFADTLVSTWALSDAADPEMVLGEIARVLKPSGHFLFIERPRPAVGNSRGLLAKLFNRSALPSQVPDLLSLVERHFAVDRVDRRSDQNPYPDDHALIIGTAHHLQVAA